MKGLGGAIKFSRRKTRLSAIVLGAILATAVAVTAVYWHRRIRQGEPVRAPQPLPSDINQKLSGYTFTRSDEGRQIFTIHAARTVAFEQGGKTVLEDVFVEIFGKTGERRDVLKTHRCDYNTQSGDFFSSGNVEIELNAPVDGRRTGETVFLETSQLHFQQNGAVVVSDQPVRYRVGPITGTAEGLTYGAKEGWLELTREVKAVLHPRATGTTEQPLGLVASRARYEKARNQILLTGPVVLTRGEGRLVAGRGTVLLDDRNQLVRLHL